MTITKHITIFGISNSKKMMKLFVFKKNIYFVSISIFYHISFTVDCRYFVISIITTYPIAYLKLWFNLIGSLLLTLLFKPSNYIFTFNSININR